MINLSVCLYERTSALSDTSTFQGIVFMLALLIQQVYSFICHKLICGLGHIWKG